MTTQNVIFLGLKGKIIDFKWKMQNLFFDPMHSAWFSQSGSLKKMHQHIGKNAMEVDWDANYILTLSAEAPLCNIPKTETKHYHDSLTTAPVLWNAFPIDIRKIQTLEKFKSAIRIHLFGSFMSEL